VDTSTLVGVPINNEPPVDEKINQIRQPYYNQVLQKRIQTLDADREVLRQMNRNLVDENENLKVKAKIDASAADSIGGL